MKRYSSFVLLIPLLAAMLTTQYSVAQDTGEDAKIAQTKALIANQNYVFKAQTMYPLSGPSRQLTSDYDLKITKDVITSYLPYIGRAYTAPIGSSDGGFQFTSKDFEYTSTKRKKDGWDISIKFKDAKDVTLMQLTIFNDGTSTLQVNSNNRQSISFKGYITSSAKKK